ncbi:MAG: CoA pyrophosphatase [Actinomycetota bacterium]
MESNFTEEIESLRNKLSGTDHAPHHPDATVAAVLVPIVMREQGPSLIFTRRTDDLPNHRSEICFPGGKADRDENGKAAALREAEEELGITPDDVELLGRLPAVFTIVSGFSIEPWVGIVKSIDLTPNPREIADVFEVTFDHLRSVRRDQKFIRDGQMYINPAYDAGDNIIWGATARILSHLLELLG